MTLIETHSGESDAELQAVTDGILQRLNPEKPNWWHPYELRGTYRRDGKVFREFFCIAGSVQIWLWKLAGEHRTREVFMLEAEAAERPAVSLVERASAHVIAAVSSAEHRGLEPTLQAAPATERRCVMRKRGLYRRPWSKTDTRCVIWYYIVLALGFPTLVFLNGHDFTTAAEVAGRQWYLWVWLLVLWPVLYGWSHFDLWWRARCAGREQGRR